MLSLQRSYKELKVEKMTSKMRDIGELVRNTVVYTRAMIPGALVFSGFKTAFKMIDVYGGEALEKLEKEGRLTFKDPLKYVFSLVTMVGYTTLEGITIKFMAEGIHDLVNGREINGVGQAAASVGVRVAAYIANRYLYHTYLVREKVHKRWIVEREQAITGSQWPQDG